MLVSSITALKFGHLTAETKHWKSASFPAQGEFQPILTSEDIQHFSKTPVDQLVFEAPEGKILTTEEKEVIKKNLIEVNELVLKTRRLKTPSNIYNASLVELENGLIGRGTGVEGHPEFSVCAEQAAICDSKANYIEKLGPKPTGTLTAGLGQMPMVKRIFHAGDRLQPCGNCLDWMHAGVVYRPGSEIIALKKAPGDKWLVSIKRGIDFMPLNFKERASFSPYLVHQLKIKASKKAEESMRQKNISYDLLRKLMAETQATYYRNSSAAGVNLAYRTQRNMAATVMLEDGTIASAPYIELRRAIQSLADTTAFNCAIQHSLQKRQNKLQKIVAVSYFGQNPEFPRPSNLHAFAHESWGGRDVLVLTVSPNTLWINTIADYLPQDYNPQKTRWSERGVHVASIISARNNEQSPTNNPNPVNPVSSPLTPSDDDDDDDDTTSDL